LNIVRKNFLVCQNKSKKALKNYLSNGELDQLHAFRLEFKKLNALFSYMLQLDQKTLEKHDFYELQKLYKQAGRIRSKEVIKNILSKYEIELESDPVEDPLYKLKYTKECKKAFKSLKYCIKKLDFHFNAYHLWMYIRALRHEGKNQINSNEPGKSWHQSRMLIKKSNFLYRLLPETFLNEEGTDYEKLAEVLGDWHDLDEIIIWDSKLKLVLNSSAKNKIIQKRSKLEEEIKRLLS
jgi:CHAD domain-containing protein